MYLQNKSFTNSEDNYDKYKEKLNYGNHNVSVETLIYDNHNVLLNCTNCKIAIKRKLTDKNKYKNSINLCFDCFENRKDLTKTKLHAIKDFFVTQNDLINLRHNRLRSKNKYCKYYKIYYTGDLIKIRDQKYDQTTIAKLINKRDKLNNKRKERDKIKKLSFESRKKEIIKECNNCAIDINDDDLNNEKIIDYLKKGEKSKHNLNDIIEFLSEEIFLIYNTDFLIYLIMETDDYNNKNLFKNLNYITYSNIKNEINKYKSKKITYNNITYNKLCIILDNKQYIDDGDLYSFIFTYIDKIFSINIKKEIYKNICAQKLNNVKYIAKRITITKIYENNKKISLPGKLSEMIISDNYNSKEFYEKENYLKKYKNIKKLSNEIYKKYYGYIKNIFPMFYDIFLKDLTYSPYFDNINIKDINKPIEKNLIKKEKK
jgi:hypothetical protein